MAVLTFDAFFRDHGVKAGLKGVSKEAQEAAKRQAEFKRQATVAGAVVGAALLKVGADSIRMASDTAESSSKVGVVFGKSADVIRRASESSAKSMGISKAAYLDAAGTLGNLFVALKLPQAEAQKMSSKMLGLASDMASFNNADPTEVLEALRSGLVGETEPLRRFGVNINEAAIKAEAMSLGLVKATKDTEKIRLAQMRAEVAQRNYAKAIKDHGKDSDEARKALVTLTVAQNAVDKAVTGTIPDLTAAQKAQATYSLITKQTTTAQGDFARTSDGLANSQRILKAQFSDMQGELGQKLLPVAIKATRAMIDLLGFIDEHKTAVTVTAGAIAGLVVAVKGLNAASSAVESWRNLSSAIGGAGTKAGGARTALGRVGTLVGAGGPWGIAIAAGVTLVGAFAAEHKKAKERVDDLKGALDQETGAMTKAARAKAVGILQDRGAFEAAKALGISVRDLTDAALGDERAQKRVNAAIEEAARKYRAMTPEQRNTSAWARDLEGRNRTLKEAIGGTNKELGEARRKLAEANAKQADAAEATEDATKATRRQRDAISELNREVRRLPRSKSVTIGAVVKFPSDWQSYRAGERKRKATGGQIGDGIGQVDEVPILAMRGEHMWTTREVAAVGGHAAMHRLRKAALAGQLQGYARGGPIGTVSTVAGVRRGMSRVESILEDAAVQWGRYLQGQLGAAGGALGGSGWAAQWAAVHRAFPWAQLTSSYRPGSITVSGNRSYHALGRAIDVSPDPAIFEWLRARYGRTSKELIFSPAGGRQIKNGRDHYYSGAVRAGHWNHVHWAYDQGGVAKGAGWMPKVTSAPERVLSPRQTVAFERMVSNPAALAGGISVTQNFSAPNYVGSHADLRRALVDLSRTGQLAAILKGWVG